MSKIFRKIFIFPLIAAASLFTNSALADNPTLEIIANGINQLVQDAKGKWAAEVKLLYEKTPNIEQTIITNANNVSSDQQNNDPYHIYDPQNLLAKDIQDILLPNPVNTNSRVLAGLPGSDFKVTSGPPQSPFSNTKNISLNPNNAVFNFNTLLSPNVYKIIETDKEKINQQQLAKNYIEYLAQGTKLPSSAILDFSSVTPEQANQLIQVKDFYDYIIATRNYAAIQSMALSNLYTIYNKRIPISGLGEKIGLNQADASVKQVESYLATRKISNINWYQTMEKASPVTIMREILYTLNEIRYEIYQSRQDSERTLATLSAIELQSLNQNQMQITLNRGKAIEVAKKLKIDLATSNI